MNTIMNIFVEKNDSMPWFSVETAEAYSILRNVFSSTLHDGGKIINGDPNLAHYADELEICLDILRMMGFNVIYIDREDVSWKGQGFGWEREMRMNGYIIYGERD